MANFVGEGFEKSLEKFRQRLSPEQRQQFSFSSLDDVRAEMRKLQDQLGPQKKLRSFNKMKKFLEGMKQVEQLVQIFLNTSDVVAYVWVASTRIETLERLLGVYQEIGDVLHGVGKYDRLFKNYPDYRRILEIYFYDILEFHHEVLQVFAKPNWRRFLDYAWPTFKTKFEPIIDSLKRHRDLLSDEKLTVILEELQDSHAIVDKIPAMLQEINEKLNKLQQSGITKKHELQERTLKQRETVRTKLRSRNYQEDHRTALKKRSISSSGNWVFDSPKFEKWLNGNSGNDSILYINGIPGSGKTILVSTIIEYLLNSGHTRNGTILYFYFKHHDNDNKGAGKTKCGMLCALLMQLLDQDDTLLEYVYQKCASVVDPDAISEPFLEEILKHCFNRQGKIWIVLDALDESEESESISAHPVIAWLQEVVSPATLYGSHVRFLISGQRDGFIEAALSVYPDIDLDRTKQHKADITDYASFRASEIKSRFGLNADEETDIVDKVTVSSKGMFLYAKIVLDNLFHQQSVAKFRKELSNENFPQELNQAYERVAIRIFDNAHEARRSSALCILGWVATSGRPLRWREIQAKFCINPVDATCDFDERILDSFKSICGSLVDVELCDNNKNSESERIVSIVHPTATRRYLQESNRIRLFEEHANAAIYFSQYLTSTPFQQKMGENRVYELALDGYYALQDYACAFWHHHISLALSPLSNISPNLETAVIHGAKLLIRISQPKARSDSSFECENLNDHTKEYILSILEEPYALGSEGSALSEQIKNVRNQIESINYSEVDGRQLKVFNELHGCIRFKCPKIRCALFSSGFSSKEQQSHHIREHDRPFKCSKPECFARITGFSSLPSLNEHIKRLHSSDPPVLFPKGKDAGSSTIHNAAARGDLNDVIALHEAGASLHFVEQKKDGLAPIVLAVKKGHMNVCEYIMKRSMPPINPWGPIFPKSGSVSDYYIGDSPIEEAVKNDDLQLFDLLRYLSPSTPSTHAIGSTICMAIGYGSEKIFARIFEEVEYCTAILNRFKDSRTPGNRWETLCKICSTASRLQSNFLEKQKLFLGKFLAKLMPALYELKDLAALSPQEMSDINEALVFLYAGNSSSLLSVALSMRAYAVAEFSLDLRETIESKSSFKVLLGVALLGKLAGNKGERREPMKLCIRQLMLRLISAVGPERIQDAWSRGIHSPPLREAAWANNVACLEALIPFIHDLDEDEKNEGTILDIAAEANRREMVKLLIESGRVDLKQKNRKSQPILESRNGKWFLCVDAISARERRKLTPGDLEPICDDTRNAVVGSPTDFLFKRKSTTS
ncbi:hypothetical protein AOL_s00210g219 [Orbilia oligospora ATCC 24927]|uniref:NACHT domain-containing protein n=1 Tax=Arthrobotrys oligospora (strain ATCC 24927 / CBS 115.81 / DSM 1491) TaxID=756982 RepID=G1XS61_ARTOA|nr:hypothetical protein AOL_s00210g219 [Orbilia oligospora ATCC 24927]EGX44058.1 hypothetical protein AOL_s00210g219 [Orbilia oligospora ATCC 24927]